MTTELTSAELDEIRARSTRIDNALVLFESVADLIGEHRPIGVPVTAVQFWRKTANAAVPGHRDVYRLLGHIDALDKMIADIVGEPAP